MSGFGLAVITMCVRRLVGDDVTMAIGAWQVVRGSSRSHVWRRQVGGQGGSSLLSDACISVQLFAMHLKIDWASLSSVTAPTYPTGACKESSVRHADRHTVLVWRQRSDNIATGGLCSISCIVVGEK